MGLSRLVTAIYLAGVVCIATGFAFYDWRLAPIVVGVALVVPVLLLKESE